MKLKKKLRKKNGEILDQGIVILLGIMALFLLISVSITDVGLIDKNIKANRLARAYLLKIESCGYLTQSDSDKLKSSLENIGLKNIDLSGTTTAQVNNGDDVYLDIKYQQPIKSIKIEGFKIKYISENKNVEIPISSTAKNY